MPPPSATGMLSYATGGQTGWKDASSRGVASRTGDDEPARAREPAWEAEGQAAKLPLYDVGRAIRLVSFLVSFMFVHLRASPATTGPCLWQRAAHCPGDRAS